VHRSRLTLGAAALGIVGVMAPLTATPVSAASTQPTYPTSVTISSAQPCIVNGTKVSGSLVVATSGGPITVAEQKAWFTPFTKLCGVPITAVSPESLPKVQAMEAAHHVTWDLTDDYGPTDTVIGIADGDWRQLPAGLFAGMQMNPASVNAWGVWAEPYATVVAFSKKDFPAGSPQPVTVQDFFNVKKFPGARCMDNSALDALEYAQLDLGYNFRTEPYELNIKADLAVLSTIKSDVKVWWTTGNQPIDDLLNGECAITQVWNGRIFLAAQTIPGFSKEIGYSYQASLLRNTWYHVIKNDPNPLAALALLRFMNGPKPQAAFANETGYGGGDNGAVQYMSAAAKTFLATAPANVAAEKGQTDETWWLHNNTPATNDFNAWLIG
jgi:putative spermidine/putrescine transport system substrate-binding protein